MFKKKVTSLILAAAMTVLSFGMCGTAYSEKGSLSPGYKVLLKGGTLTNETRYTPSKGFFSARYKAGENGAFIVVFKDCITDAMKVGVENEGATLNDFLPDQAFLAQMTPETAEKIKNLPYVADVLVYQPEYKVDPELKNRADDTLKNDEIDVVLNFFNTSEGIENQSKKIDAKLISKYQKKAVLKIKKDKVKDLSEIPEVKYISINPKFKVTNSVARGMVLGSEDPWALGIDGAGEVVGVADTGLDTGVNDSTMHQDFQGRINSIFNWCTDTARDYSGHGTHVAGSVLGNGARSNGKIKGTAPGARLVFQALGMDYDPDGMYPPDDLNLLFQEAYNANARIHTNSWGAFVGGEYTDKSQDVDEFVWNHKDMTILFSAGNEGIYGDNTIGAPGTAKNCITVGAAESFRPKDDVPSISISDNLYEIANFSSRGWCADGRIKPDIVSPGTWIASAKSSYANTIPYPYYANPYYQYKSGTSMATPLTAGAVAAARQYIKGMYNVSNPSAALMKAFLINGATDTGMGQPSKLQGWGKTNLYNSIMGHKTSSRFFIDQTANLSTGDVNRYTTTVTSTSQPLKITLAWSDYPGSIPSSKALVNDLDLKVTTPSGQVLYGNNLGGYLNSSYDRVNNVENVFIQTPQTGVYTIEVNGYQIPQGPQNYALVSSHGFVPTVTNIMATTTTNSISLSWDPVPGATSYDVLIDGSTTVNTSTTSYSHTGLSSGSKHSYKVFPNTASLTGAWSYIADFSTDIAVPTNFRASKISGTSVTLTWDPCAGAGWYRVEMDNNSKYTYRSTTNSIVINNLLINSTHSFKVCAYAEGSKSAWTNSLDVTTLSSGLSTIPDMPTQRSRLGMAESGGKIYAVGGYNGTSDLNTVACYDPAQETWTSKSGLVYPRSYLGVVSNGSNIYAVGGLNGTTPSKKLEVYNTVTNTWSTLADAPTARYMAGTAVVGNKIYVMGGIGGVNGTTEVATVEVYNISTNTWQTLPNMSTAKSGFALAVNGNWIYAFGGKRGTTEINTVQAFDTTSNYWMLMPSMPTARSGLGAVKINNRIYAIGGANSDKIEEYNVDTGEWALRSTLPTNRGFLGAVAYNGNAYMIGGYNGTSHLKSGFTYAPAAEYWEAKAPLSIGRTYHAAAQLNGKIYISGGEKSEFSSEVNKYLPVTSQDLLEYDPATNTWTSKTPMTTARFRHCMVALNGKLYAIGGSAANGESIASVEEYNPGTNQWTPIASMNDSRSYFSAAVVNNKIYVMGGLNADSFELGTVEEYDPGTGIWTNKSDMLNPRTVFGTAVVNGKIYTIGGRSVSAATDDDIEEFNPVTNTWTFKRNYDQVISGAGIAALNNKIYIMGGVIPGGDRITTIKEYDPAAGTITLKGNFLDERAYAGVAVLGDKIYVIGGDILSDFWKGQVSIDWSLKDNFVYTKPTIN
ncbi:MAG: S8 family serine peptidase [Clostridia bacterium]|nr:S8 family serine peptidase [Clostridia bacterium]